MSDKTILEQWRSIAYDQQADILGKLFQHREGNL